MNKQDVIDTLQVILDGLTSGESSKEEINKLKVFYENELHKVNDYKNFLERVVKVLLLNDYGSISVMSINTPSPQKLFDYQMKYNVDKFINNSATSNLEIDKFNSFVEDYIEAAKRNEVIGLKEEGIGDKY